MNSALPVVFMLDTNILVKWMQPYLEGTSARTPGIRAFCENTPHPVIVPDIVWLELISFFVHKNIQLGIDWADTVRQFRDKQTLVQQLEQLIRNRPNWEFQWRPTAYDSPFKNAIRLMQDHNLLDRQQYNRMLKRAEKNYKKDSPKLLDGLDSAIMMYLNEFASHNPGKQVILYTADYPLFCITNNNSWKNKSWVANNFKSIFALFPTLRCRSCGHNNPVSVLNTLKMRCQNSATNPHSIIL